MQAQLNEMIEQKVGSKSLGADEIRPVPINLPPI